MARRAGERSTPSLHFARFKVATTPVLLHVRMMKDSIMQYNVSEMHNNDANQAWLNTMCSLKFGILRYEF
jgi:hypothetical protein